MVFDKECERKNQNLRIKGSLSFTWTLIGIWAICFIPQRSVPMLIGLFFQGYVCPNLSQKTILLYLLFILVLEIINRSLNLNFNF